MTGPILAVFVVASVLAVALASSRSSTKRASGALRPWGALTVTGLRPSLRLPSPDGRSSDRRGSGREVLAQGIDGGGA